MKFTILILALAFFATVTFGAEEDAKVDSDVKKRFFGMDASSLSYQSEAGQSHSKSKSAMEQSYVSSGWPGRYSASSAAGEQYSSGGGYDRNAFSYQGNSF